MFTLVPRFAIELNWTSLIVGFSITTLALACLVTYLDKDDDEMDEMKEGFADYVSEAPAADDASDVADLPAAPVRPEAPKDQEAQGGHKTRWQTADVSFHRDPYINFQTLGYAPVIPPALQEALKTHFVCIQTPDGRKVTWNKDGSVIVDDETKKIIFWPCPTLADAVFHRDWNNKPTSFKFNSDGSVVAKCYDATYYFGPLEDGGPEPEVGEELADGHECPNDDNWWYGYKNCYCLVDAEEARGCLCGCQDVGYDEAAERSYYDSEDEFYPRCAVCLSRHDPVNHDCRWH